MRSAFRWIAIILLGGSVVTASARGGELPNDAATSGRSTAQAPPVRYVPPLRGAPDARVSGGTRGPVAERLKLDVLAPEHVGRTLQEQPTLYWFNSRPITTPVELTVVADDTNRTVLKAPLTGPFPAGIHAFRLVGTSARLAQDVNYQWSVTAINSTQEPSRNVVASGMVRRVARAAVERTLPTGSLDRTAATYAEAGIWYDALDALSQAIQRNPADRALRRERSSLLEQVGLKEAAEFDLQSLQ